MTSLPAAKVRTGRDLRHGEAALDGALLRQDGLLATLITAGSGTRSAASLDHSELMRLVKSQRTLLSASRKAALPLGELNDAGEVFPIQREVA